MIININIHGGLQKIFLLFVVQKNPQRRSTFSPPPSQIRNQGYFQTVLSIFGWFTTVLHFCPIIHIISLHIFIKNWHKSNMTHSMFFKLFLSSGDKCKHKTASVMSKNHIPVSLLCVGWSPCLYLAVSHPSDRAAGGVGRSGYGARPSLAYTFCREVLLCRESLLGMACCRDGLL